MAFADDHVAGGLAGDVERLENGNAAGDEGAEGAREARDGALAGQIAEERELAACKSIDDRAPGRWCE